jgi:hypothetical protein
MEWVLTNNFRLNLPVYEYVTNTLASALHTANLDDFELVALLALVYTTNCKRALID